MPILFTKIQFHDHPAAFTVAEFFLAVAAESVSYTHLDVYKRQALHYGWCRRTAAGKVPEPYTPPRGCAAGILETELNFGHTLSEPEMI